MKGTSPASPVSVLRKAPIEYSAIVSRPPTVSGACISSPEILFHDPRKAHGSFCFLDRASLHRGTVLEWKSIQLLGHSIDSGR